MSSFQLCRLLLDAIRFDKADIIRCVRVAQLVFLTGPRYSHRVACLFKIMFGNVFPEHVFPLHPAVAHENHWSSLNQDSKSM